MVFCFKVCRLGCGCYSINCPRMVQHCITFPRTVFPLAAHTFTPVNFWGSISCTLCGTLFVSLTFLQLTLSWTTHIKPVFASLIFLSIFTNFPAAFAYSFPRFRLFFLWVNVFYLPWAPKANQLAVFTIKFILKVLFTFKRTLRSIHLFIIFKLRGFINYKDIW